MPDANMPNAPVQTPAPAEPEIVVIPEKFYGAALKAKTPEAKERTEGPGGLVQPPKRGMMLPIIIGVVVLLVLVGGGFVYFNSSLLFPPAQKPAPVVEQPAPTPTPAPQPPSSPTNVLATSTNPQSASISWIDTATNESGFRIERAEGTGDFQSLTSLPPNSSSFQDIAVTASTTYRYRIIALNQAGESQPSPEVQVTVLALPPPAPPAPTLPPAGLDTDSDGLTDLEEALFGTNPRNPDTDSDGFLDGNEVFHLYNPNGRAPGKLIEAGLVKEVKGTVGWTMDIPKDWTLKLTKNDGTEATIVTGKPESFTISVKDNPQSLPIVQWYMADHPNVQESQLLQYRSKKGYEGIIGADLLTTYIPWGNHVFVFTYNLDDQPFINYRTTYSMMLNSLVLTGLPQITVPVAGETLPFEPAATTTGVIAQPEAIFPTDQPNTGTTSATPTPPAAFPPPPPPPETPTSTP